MIPSRAVTHVALATCDPLPEHDPDAPLLAQALTEEGIDAEVVAWERGPEDFLRARWTVVRSTWNYVHHLDAYLTWIDALEGRILNPAPVLRWNIHKRYLLDLAARGVATVPTRVVARGEAQSLGALLDTQCWTRAVAKPAVSAASFETRRVAHGSDRENERWFAACLESRDMLVQPYLDAVEDYGERSLVWIDGALTHAIRKSPRFAGGAERVSESAVSIADDERELAQRAVRAAQSITGSDLLYARIDLARDAAGNACVMELELIEPSLFFAQGPDGLQRFARAIARRC